MRSSSPRAASTLCFFGSFGYFDDDDNLRHGRALAQALRPGGKLLVDTQVMETVFTRFLPRSWGWSGAAGASTRVLEERRFDLESRRIVVSWTFVDPDDRVETVESSIRLYAYAELCELLRAAGFARFQGLETLTSAPFRLGAQRLSLIAHKE